MSDFKTRIEKAFGTQRGAKSAAARALGVAQPQLSLAMTDKRPPSSDMLRRLEQFEQGLPVAGIAPSYAKELPRRAAALPIAPDDSTPAQRAAVVRAELFSLLDGLQANGWTGRDMAAACPELFRAWRAR